MGRQFEIYQHYTGGLYLKLGEALHTETGGVLVVYACAVSGEMWARPKVMFEGRLTGADNPEERGGKVGQKRFALVPYTEDKKVRTGAAVLDSNGDFLADRRVECRG